MEMPQAGSHFSHVKLNDQLMIHTTEHVSGAENGAERTGNRLERSGTVSEIQKIKWSVSGAGAGGRRNG